MTNPKLRCKCRKCGRTQLVSIQEYLIGAKCYLGKSIKAPDFSCGGKLEYFSDGTEDSLLNAANLLQYLRKESFDEPHLAELVDTVADDIGCWLAGVQTPEEMGWVNSKGQP